MSLAAFKSEVAAAYRKFDFAQKCWVIFANDDEHLERYLAMMHIRFCADVPFTDANEDEAKHGERHDEREQQSGRRKTSSSNGGQEGKRERRDHQPQINVGRAYDVLYLQAGAPLPLIQAAYKTLAKLHHPDVVGGDGATMAEINNAYDVLIRKLSTAAA